MARITIASLQSRIAELEAQLAAQAQPEPELLEPTDHVADQDLADYAALHCGIGHLPRKAPGTVVSYFTKANGERWMRERTGNRSVLRPCA